MSCKIVCSHTGAHLLSIDHSQSNERVSSFLRALKTKFINLTKPWTLQKVVQSDPLISLMPTHLLNLSVILSKWFGFGAISSGG